jgi:hypothetical protein
MKIQNSYSLIKVIFGAAIFTGGLIAWSPKAWSDSGTRTIILNEAVVVFESSHPGSQTPRVSNEVTVTIDEMTRVPLTDLEMSEASNGIKPVGLVQGDDAIANGDVSYSPFILFNAGNNLTQFLLPKRF